MWLAMILLFGSLMFSGIGLFFLVAAAIRLALTPARRMELVWLAPLALALGAWDLAHRPPRAPPKPGSLAAQLEGLPLYVFLGLCARVPRLLREGGPFGP